MLKNNRLDFLIMHNEFPEQILKHSDLLAPNGANLANTLDANDGIVPSLTICQTINSKTGSPQKLVQEKELLSFCANCQTKSINLIENLCPECHASLIDSAIELCVEIEANSNTITSNPLVKQDAPESGADSVSDTVETSPPSVCNEDKATKDIKLISSETFCPPKESENFENIPDNSKHLDEAQTTSLESQTPHRYPTRSRLTLKRKAEEALSVKPSVKKVKSNPKPEEEKDDKGSVIGKQTPRSKGEGRTPGNSEKPSCVKESRLKTGPCETSTSTTTENINEKLKDLDLPNEFSDKETMSLLSHAEKVEETVGKEVREDENNMEIEKEKAGILTEPLGQEIEGWDHPCYLLDGNYDFFIECYAEEDDFINIHEVRKRKDEFEIIDNKADGGQYLNSIVYPLEDVIRTGYNYQTKIPGFRKRSGRPKPKKKWDPETISEEEFEKYTVRLMEITGVSNDKLIEQRVAEILAEHEYNIEKTLEFVEENVNRIRNKVMLKKRKTVI